MRAVGKAERAVNEAGGFGNIIDIFGAAGHMLMRGIVPERGMHRAVDFGLRLVEACGVHGSSLLQSEAC
ncbi:hypothetical protein D3C80_110390 [compost metagenome]